MSTETDLSMIGLLRPDELLENAKYLLDLQQKEAFRGVVLESMTALEVYVHNKVFRLLEQKYDPAFVKWLKERTDLNFDYRLGIITPFALTEDIKAFKESDLWRRYRMARTLRNDVTHKGLEVSREEAEEVYKTMYDWLAYLESSLGLELSLLEFKNTILAQGRFTSINDYYNLLKEFYLRSSVHFNLKSITQIKYPIETAFEWGLKFGHIIVSLDTKVYSKSRYEFSYVVETIIGQTRIKIRASNIDKAAIILFYDGTIPESFEFVRHFEDLKIYIIAIEVKVVDYPFN